MMALWTALVAVACLSAGSEPPAELTLGADYRIAASSNMPSRGAVGPLRFSRRDYPEHRAVEWQTTLAAPADGSGPLFDDSPSADFVVRFPSSDAATLHWSRGSQAEPADFEPRVEPLVQGKPFALESFGGRSSDGAMPYFNLAAEGGGLIAALGWSGDWKASFEALSGGRVRVRMGLQRCRFRLPAGERARLPSTLVMAYSGDWIDGQNRFRRLVLERFTPQSRPPLELMPVAASVHGLIGFNETTEANLVALASELGRMALPLDTFWLDAGWNEGGFPLGQGNPHADARRFPRGLAPVGKAAAAAGLRLLVWFEPERAMPRTWLAENRRDWLLAPGDAPDRLRYHETDGFRLLDLGNPAARRWALERLSQTIVEAGIDVYRQDFNLYPALFWRPGEPAEAVGLRETRHVAGLYELLDELARRHPRLIVDNCASGGRRLDFEMLRRAVVLWRSDSCWDAKSYPRNVQAMTHGLSLWLPLHGLGAAAAHPTALRSGMGACGSFAIDYRDPRAVAALREHLGRYLAVRRLFACDYYPLTPWSLDPSRWLAFQFHDPATGEGLVQAFRGATGAESTLALRLRGLVPDRSYVFVDWDRRSTPFERGGREAAERGLEATARGQGEQAIVVEYRPKRGS